MMGMGKQLLMTDRFSVEEVTSTGADGRPRQRAIVRHPGAVTILPLLEGDRVCLIRNFRISVEKELIELPAGTLEPPETPEETARRELREETGFEAGRLRLLHAFYLSPGVLDERMHLFVAEDLRPVGPAREAGEQIENLIVPWSEAIRLCQSGAIEDAKTLVGLLLSDRLRSPT